MSGAVVEVWRGSFVESRHRVSVAVVDAQGRLRASAGDPGTVAFARSALKPIQSLPMVEDGASEQFGFGPDEIALCCASHSGEARHVEAVRSMLRKIGVDEEALACGPHQPMSAQAAEALRTEGKNPGRVHNNCSGKHVGMLALARFHGWPVTGYQLAEHPVQLRLLTEVARWSGTAEEDIPTAVDGCGVVTYALSLQAMAASFGRLAGATRCGDAVPSQVVHAMLRYPEFVGGTERLCTQLMRVADGRIFAKVGAEGVYCAGIPGAELGVALKVEDGATRAAEPALLAVLRGLGLLSADEMADLGRFAEPDIVNTRGERVGRIRADVVLEAVNG
ncbi:MAG: asparaginase [Longimicrobiales bacterium]